MTSHHELVYKVKTGECKSPFEKDFPYQLDKIKEKYMPLTFLFDSETANFLDYSLYKIIEKNVTLTKVEEIKGYEHIYEFTSEHL